jgi:DNA polymerase/3'-5' exonuclease PolX
MSAGEPIAWEDAAAIARWLTEALRPAALRIEVAGSIRRRKQLVRDIELVAVPRTTVEMRQVGLWEPEEVVVNHLQAAIDEGLNAGWVRVHPTDPKRGDRYAKLVAPGFLNSGRERETPDVQLDLFMPASLEVFGLALAIRTGPAEYSQRLVTDARRAGYHVAEGELHTGSMSCAGATTKRCHMVPTPEERDVFDRLGMRWVAPQDRA